MDSKFWLENLWDKTEAKLRCTAVRCRDIIPYTADQNGRFIDRVKPEPECWTNGFWGGLMWLMYKATGCEEYKKTARKSEQLLEAAFSDFEKLHHDVGFMFHITYGADYRITGDKCALSKELFAAAALYSRFNVDGKFIRAWNQPEAAGWSIIDCLMNIPLLYFASDKIGDDRFRRVAMHHADMSLRDHIRPDGSVNHIVEHDLLTGDAIKTYGGQGFGEGSCWSRGLAWALYGITLSYIHTGKKEYLDAAVRTANYFCANIVKFDYKTPIDFRQPKEPEYYDSTAGLCAACGLIELSKCVSESEGEAYTNAAVNVIRATAENFCRFDDETDYIVGFGSERYPRSEAEKSCVHIPIIYADFFLAESLIKLKGTEFLIW